MVETKKSFCRFCHAFCAIEVDVEDNKVVEIRGDTSDPIYGGYTCIKGRHLPEQHNHPERLRSSLKRMPDSSFQPISSEQALDEIAERLSAIIAEHGPRAGRQLQRHVRLLQRHHALGHARLARGHQVALLLHQRDDRSARQGDRRFAPRDLGGRQPRVRDRRRGHAGRQQPGRVDVRGHPALQPLEAAA